MPARTDTERLNWLSKNDGCALVSDDAGRWVVTVSGMQNVPDPEKPTDIETCYFIEAAEWQPSLRAAIDAAMLEEKRDA